MNCLPLCSLCIAHEFWTGGLSLDNNCITSLASTATGTWDNICSLASYLLTKGKGEIISLLEAQDSLCKKEAICQHTLKTHGDEVSLPALCVPSPRALLFYQ